VAQRRRHEAPNVLHQEELGVEVSHKPKELPKQGAARILNGRPLAGRAEGLTGWPTDQQIDLARLKAQVMHDLLG
jgi:hypothetical protein